MSPRVTYLVILGALVLGLVLGRACQSDHDARTVTVTKIKHEVKTRVVTKTKELPESCRDALDKFAAADKALGDAVGDSGHLMLLLDQGGVAAAQSAADLNQVIAQIMSIKDKFENDALESKELADIMHTYMKTCLAESGR